MARDQFPLRDCGGLPAQHSMLRTQYCRGAAHLLGRCAADPAQALHRLPQRAEARRARRLRRARPRQAGAHPQGRRRRQGARARAGQAGRVAARHAAHREGQEAGHAARRRPARRRPTSPSSASGSRPARRRATKPKEDDAGTVVAAPTRTVRKLDVIVRDEGRAAEDRQPARHARTHAADRPAAAGRGGRVQPGRQAARQRAVYGRVTSGTWPPPSR